MTAPLDFAALVCDAVAGHDPGPTIDGLASCMCSWRGADHARHVLDLAEHAVRIVTVPDTAPAWIAQALADPAAEAGGITARSAAAVFQLVRDYDRTGTCQWDDHGPDVDDLDAEIVNLREQLTAALRERDDARAGQTTGGQAPPCTDGHWDNITTRPESADDVTAPPLTTARSSLVLAAGQDVDDVLATGPGVDYVAEARRA